MIRNPAKKVRRPVRQSLVAITVILLFFPVILAAQGTTLRQKLEWDDIQQLKPSDDMTEYHLYFDGAVYMKDFLDVPVFSLRIPAPSSAGKFTATLEDVEYQPLRGEIARVKGIDRVGTEISIDGHIAYERKQPYGVIYLVPVRKNPVNGSYEKLVSFTLKPIFEEGVRGKTGNRYYKNTSVLASGDWVRISVRQTGVHRISYNDLQQYGINPESIDPRDIRIYGNGGGMLPESLGEFRYDDLVENAITVSGENDGSFDQGDYILFYGESPHTWTYNEQTGWFSHSFNIYSNETYYFLTTDLGRGKRISQQPGTSGQPTNTVTKFLDHQFHEEDLINLVNTGRMWYGEIFDVQTTRNFLFTFPNIDVTSSAYLKAFVAAKSSNSSQFRFSDGNTQILSGNVSGIPSTSETYARNYVGNATFTPSGPNLQVKVDYIKSSPNSIGWLNYLELNVTRFLSMTGDQMSFRAPSQAAPGNISEFRLSNASAGVNIWNVTDPANIQQVSTDLNGQQMVFRLPHDSLTEFIAFNGNSYFTPVFVEKVANQNLHGLSSHDMLIIVHPAFLSEANRLANYHRDKSGLSVYITEPQLIYNEFSSGAQDISAIRDFLKMLYDKAPAGEEPDYLLLFGDASFDYKDRIENNSNFVPTWEDDESLTIVYSIATDDFYGFLDEGSDDLLDIGIGRLPVESMEQAVTAVDKIIEYSSNAESVLGEWRNYLCFVADDEDGNLHINQAEEMAIRLDTNYGRYNIDKIYLDAFPQIITPGGQRAPEVNQAINNRMQKGTLLVNYTGHGGEVGWAHERILELSDISSWSNGPILPIFITATCEFSRYDDPDRVSAGEQVFRHTNGGAIAMFTTARATFGGSNFNLNQALFDYMFEKDNGVYPRFGDLIRQAKNKNGVADNDKKFILLGDPALRLAYPDYSVHTNTINQKAAGDQADTLKALGKITVTGEIRDGEGNKVTSYNGFIYPKVFDKPAVIKTLATDDGSYEKEFELQNNILYKGKSRVSDGEFSFSFIVPKDIAYKYGYGKISYYSSENQNDASGYYDNIMIGGFDTAAPADNHGPEMQLYMNDESFAFGGITNENPMILAFVEDESGINTVGNGIGHDIVAILDENSDKPIVLNDYYEAELDSYQRGSIRYSLSNLEEGRHSITLKVWDVHNNSSQEYTEFVVAREAELAIEHVLNYPNPFTTHTDFFFDHNQPGDPLEVQIQIFTVSGRLIKTIDSFIMTNGFRSEPIAWDGTDDFGDRIGRGVYLYKLRVRNSEGDYAEKLEKLVILR